MNAFVFEFYNVLIFIINAPVYGECLGAECPGTRVGAVAWGGEPVQAPLQPNALSLPF